MPVRKFKIQQVLESMAGMRAHLADLTEEEVLAALDLECSTLRRGSMIDRLISRAARINELSYVAKLKEKYHGSP